MSNCVQWSAAAPLTQQILQSGGPESISLKWLIEKQPVAADLQLYCLPFISIIR